MKIITQSMISHWVGSDHDSKEAYLNLLFEILNGIYDVQSMRDDVLELWEETV